MADKDVGLVSSSLHTNNKKDPASTENQQQQQQQDASASTDIQSSVEQLHLKSSSINNKDMGEDPMMETEPLPKAHNDNSSSATTSLSSDTTFELPKMALPPKSVLKPVQTFVAKAIHDLASSSDPSAQAQKSYRALMEAVRFQHDPDMVWHILLALRTSGNTLNWVVSQQQFSSLVHHIVRLNPFDTQVQAVEGDTENQRTYTFVDLQPEEKDTKKDANRWVETSIENPVSFQRLTAPPNGW